MAQIDDRTLMMIFALVFLIMQFILHLFTRNLTKGIVGAFDAHVVESAEIHTLVKSLAAAHAVVDADGKPLWYMPASMVETQTELVKLSHTIAQTQKMICSMSRETRKDIENIGEDIKEHAKECRAKP